MQTLFPLALESLFEVPQTVIADTEMLLQQHGAQGHEGMVFWGGVPLEGRVEIRRAIHPAQSCSAFGVDVDPGAIQEMYRILERHGEILLAQVHSHPDRAFHSSRDDDFPATFLVGFLSVVVPDFCIRGLRLKDECRVWMHTGQGRWRELSAWEKDCKFLITRGAEK